MKLYMKEKFFSWNDQFTVKDENGWDKYYVEGEFLSLGKRLHVTDINGREAAFIQQRLLTLMPCYSVSVAGREIEGSVWEHEYQIRRNGRTIAIISKEWFTWGDSYCLEILDPADEILALAVVLTIDCVVEAQNSN